MLFTKAKKERVEKEQEDLAKVFIDYKTRLRNAEQDILKKQGMTAALSSYVICLQPSKHKFMAEKKSLNLINAELVNKSKQASHGTPPARHKKIATSLPRHLFRRAVEG